MLHRKLLVASFLILLPWLSVSEEVAADSMEDSAADEFSWQFTGSTSLVYAPTILKDGEDPGDVENIISLSLLLDLYYKGFFIQTNQRRIDSLTANTEIGYQLITRPNWEFDIIHKTYVYGYDPDEIIKDIKQDDSILAGLDTRDEGHGIGLRYSHFYDQSVLSFEVASLISLDAGADWVAEAFYSYLIPYRNWDIYLGTGLTYYTEDVVNYYVGINAKETTEQRSLYQANDGFKVQLEVFAQHPISKKWTVNVGVNSSWYSNSFVDSPIVDTQINTIFTLGAMYAF